VLCVVEVVHGHQRDSELALDLRLPLAGTAELFRSLNTDKPEVA